MAPTRSKKRMSTESTSSVNMLSFPAPPQLIPTKTRSPVRTPSNRSPIKKVRKGITLAQKQALIDNLQLEITERARKLRAQYMLQAQGLRTRVEIRVNRIPVALRRAKIGDLLLKYSESGSKQILTAPASPTKVQSPAKNLMQVQNSLRASPSPQRGAKRQSNEMTVDKENEDIENPKKRVRGAPQQQRASTRGKLQTSQVLSPRSANSRTLPGSPIRPTTPGRSYLARPVSPLKPAPSERAAVVLTSMVEKAKATRGTTAGRKDTRTTAATGLAAGGVGRGRRTAGPPVPPKTGRGRAISDSSDGSNGTVVRKPVPPPKKAAPAKKTVMGTIKGIGAAAKKAPVNKAAVSAPGGRVLRKRN